jgi:hypothetical protein
MHGCIVMCVASRREQTKQLENTKAKKENISLSYLLAAKSVQEKKIALNVVLAQFFLLGRFTFFLAVFCPPFGWVLTFDPEARAGSQDTKPTI